MANGIDPKEVVTGVKDVVLGVAGLFVPEERLTRLDKGLSNAVDKIPGGQQPQPSRADHADRADQLSIPPSAPKAPAAQTTKTAQTTPVSVTSAAKTELPWPPTGERLKVANALEVLGYSEQQVKLILGGPTTILSLQEVVSPSTGSRPVVEGTRIAQVDGQKVELVEGKRIPQVDGKRVELVDAKVVAPELVAKVAPIAGASEKNGTA